MFPIAILIRGSLLYGDIGEDVDMFVPYAAGSAQVFKGVPMMPATLKEGYLDYEAMEIGTIVKELSSGNSKVLISVLSPAQIMATHWYVRLKSILVQNLSTEFGEDLLKHISEIYASDKENKLEIAARSIRFGLGYYKDQSLVLHKPEDNVTITDEWYAENLSELISAIESAKTLEGEDDAGNTYKVYDHNLMVSNLVSWLVTVRSNVFKIEDGIL